MLINKIRANKPMQSMRRSIDVTEGSSRPPPFLFARNKNSSSIDACNTPYDNQMATKVSVKHRRNKSTGGDAWSSSFDPTAPSMVPPPSSTVSTLTVKKKSRPYHDIDNQRSHHNKSQSWKPSTAQQHTSIGRDPYFETTQAAARSSFYNKSSSIMQNRLE